MSALHRILVAATLALATAAPNAVLPAPSEPTAAPASAGIICRCFPGFPGCK